MTRGNHPSRSRRDERPESDFDHGQRRSRERPQSTRLRHSSRYEAAARSRRSGHAKPVASEDYLTKAESNSTVASAEPRPLSLGRLHAPCRSVDAPDASFRALTLTIDHIWNKNVHIWCQSRFDLSYSKRWEELWSQSCCCCSKAELAGKTSPVSRRKSS